MNQRFILLGIKKKDIQFAIFVAKFEFALRVALTFLLDLHKLEVLGFGIVDHLGLNFENKISEVPSALS